MSNVIDIKHALNKDSDFVDMKSLNKTISQNMSGEEYWQVSI